jgi:predicted RNA-binding Zn-ribbon protein involved in translation (DUF1610 family)
MHATAASEAGHPDACPWCGRQQIHGVRPSPTGDRLYRCVACGTTFFIHQLPQRQAERPQSPLCPPPVTARRRFISRFAHKR